MAKHGGIRIAIAGIGNCASSLIQGIYYYSPERCREGVVGLMHTEIGGYRPCDIEVVAAFDVDARKVCQDVNRAIFAKPNCTTVFQADIPDCGVTVQMGQVLDGISEHMADYDEDRTYVRAEATELSKAEIVALLKSRIASDKAFAARFAAAKLPIIGDDIKSQVGATITHRVLTDLFAKRGVKLLRTYQLNTGGNTDFLNMKNQERLVSKKLSKTEAVQAVAKKRMASDDIHVGPSDYVPWQNDNKICFIRMEGLQFGDVPMDLELRLSVQDSPNSAGVVIDMIRCCKLALESGIGGVLEGPSAYFCKHPPVQYTDDIGYEMTEDFIRSHRRLVVTAAE
jgi:myo-inositol-1-phosphate synthase